MGNKGKSKYYGVFTEGQKFGRYTILGSKIKIDREAKVECKCECGISKWVSCYSLSVGTSTQCSKCGNSMVKSDNPAWKGYGEIPSRMFGKLQRDAKLRGLVFEISIEYCDKLFKEQGGICRLSGIKLKTNSNGSTASLDRIDNTKGYIEGNVQWLHKDVNMMKRTYTQEHFVKMCELISDNFTELAEATSVRGKLVQLAALTYVHGLIFERFEDLDIIKVGLQKELDAHLNFETKIGNITEENGILTGHIYYKTSEGDEEFRVSTFTVVSTGVIVEHVR